MTPQYTDWRQRHPSKDAAIRAFVRSQLGIRTNNQSEFATRAVDQWVVGFLSALLGWGQAPDAGTPPETRPAQLTDATEILDLETRT
jgi:hypothetical protein